MPTTSSTSSQPTGAAESTDPGAPVASAPASTTPASSGVAPAGEGHARRITILQFGSGNFLRGFVDWMVQQTNDAGLTNHGVAVVYATHRPDRVDPLAEQGGRYHVVLEGIRDGRAVRQVDQVDVVQAVVDPWADHDHYQKIALSPQLQLVVSNTTEAGIVWRPDALETTPASSFPGQVAQLLHDRFVAFDGDDAAGLDILACELIEDNGQVLRELVLRHAEQAGWDADLRDWIVRANRFHDTLVDRIVSGFSSEEADALAADGVHDAALVKGELFSLWVIGGDNQRLREVLPLDQLDLGVRFVDAEAVGPFRSKKVRVLNGAHTALAAFGVAAGHETVDQAFSDPHIRHVVQALVADEVLPTIDEPLPELEAFAAGILERFDNPSLHHRLRDICLNASAKWCTRNWPVVVDRWDADQPADRSVLALAVLLRLYAGPGSTHGFAPRDDADVLAAIAQPGFGDDAWLDRVLAAMGLSDHRWSGRLRAELADHLQHLDQAELVDVLSATGGATPGMRR